MSGFEPQALDEGTTQRLGSGGPWEERYGYARVVRRGSIVVVSGCTAIAEEGYVIGGVSAYDQARESMERAVQALGRVGAGLPDVIQTRMFVTDIERSDEVGRAHREIFGEHPPATSMVEVARLIDPRLLVEVEAMAVVGAH
jgi:enamine deaminase RidA (YjgF/YER057c/UK114 family)